MLVIIYSSLLCTFNTFNYACGNLSHNKAFEGRWEANIKKKKKTKHYCTSNDVTLPQFLVSKGENKDIKLFWCRLYMEGVLIQLQGQALCPSVEIYITKELEI